ncbi:MAG: hypothetical protein Ct9H90mP9_5400 [Pseudomonadota bacterium]|nr:MAG: hypothetical protein Ct9H90mP9_5400 [Pseudomonadota bacterium]
MACFGEEPRCERSAIFKSNLSARSRVSSRQANASFGGDGHLNYKPPQFCTPRPVPKKEAMDILPWGLWKFEQVFTHPITIDLQRGFGSLGGAQNVMGTGSQVIIPEFV